MHPGYPDAESGSAYDLARREDLDTVTGPQVRARFDEPVWGDAVRASHAEALRASARPRGAEEG